MIDLGVLYDILKTALKPGCSATAFFCQAYARTFFVWEKNPVALQPGDSKVRVIDRAVVAFATGEAFVQVKFGMYEGAIGALRNLRRVAEKASVLMLQNVSNGCTLYLS
jgi:hypothetical protein